MKSDIIEVDKTKITNPRIGIPIISESVLFHLTVSNISLFMGLLSNLLKRQYHISGLLSGFHIPMSFGGLFHRENPVYQHFQLA